MIVLAFVVCLASGLAVTAAVAAFTDLPEPTPSAAGLIATCAAVVELWPT